MDKEEKKGGESLLVPEHEQEDRESADVGFLAEQITNEAEQQIETLAQEGDVLAEKIATKFGEEVDEETRSSLQSLVEQAKKIGARLKEAIFSIIPERKVDEYALENKLTYYFNSAKIDKIKKIVDSGVLPAENIQALGRSGLGDLLRNGKFNRAKKILDSGILSDEIIRETAENAFDLLFQLDKISTIKEIADSGVLPTEFVQQALKNILSFAIRYREPMEKIKEIIDLGVLLPEIIQQVGKDCLARVVMGRSSKRIKDYIEIMGLSVEISPSELQQFGEMSMLASLRLGLTDEIKEIINFFQLSEETAKELIEKNLSEIPVSVIVKINEVFDFAKFDEAKIAWSEPLKKLLKVQDMASRREHCPWKKEIDPLVSQSVKKGFISLDRREDGEFLLNFVSEFGAFNLPLLFELINNLKKVEVVKDIDQHNLQILQEIFSPKVLDLSPEAVINEIRKFKKKFQAELLEDKIPNAIDTSLGREIFGVFRGSTKWAGEGSVEEVVKNWRETVKNSPEIAVLPEGYQKKEVEVSTLSHDPEGTKPAPDKKEQESKIIQNPELQKFYHDFWRVFQEESKITNVSNWWKNKQESIVQILEIKKGELIEKVNKIAAEKAKIGIQKSIDTLGDLIEQVKSCVLASNDSEKDLVDLMERLAPLESKSEEIRKVLQILSSFHLQRTAPPGWYEAYGKLAAGPETGDASSIKNLFDFYLNYLHEHYLNENQDGHVTNHLPFNQTLLKSLDSIWQTKGDVEKNILVQSAKKLFSLDEGKTDISNKKQKISFVPVRGLLRIFSGDVGDACYTSQRVELSEGKFSRITPIILVTNQGQSSERLMGSVLFVETKTKDKKKKVLVVRANNPRENLLSKVDANGLVQEILDYAKEVAEKRGIDEVVVPFDSASQSCSNRPAVADFYESHLSAEDKISLIDEPETNFNGYDIHNIKGNHPVVRI